MIDLKYLETLAKAATPGPWEDLSNHPDHLRGTINKGSKHIAGCSWFETWREEQYVSVEEALANAAYIAAANPAVMLELIAELRREREKYKHATIRYHEECSVRDWLAMHFYGKLEKCKTCRELPDDIVTIHDCIQCVNEYARENMGK
jgi:hypothetical protein